MDVHSDASPMELATSVVTVDVVGENCKGRWRGRGLVEMQFAATRGKSNAPNHNTHLPSTLITHPISSHIISSAEKRREKLIELRKPTNLLLLLLPPYSSGRFSHSTLLRPARHWECLDDTTQRAAGAEKRRIFHQLPNQIDVRTNRTLCHGLLRHRNLSEQEDTAE
ncbi:hypothetical protein BC567DRAFT_219932 [Phyllosticta citribraziliensis]